jgi:RHS repeat-associated protein
MFTGKELDDMTGLYYYGARYYDPRMSVWQSPDPALESYLDGKNNNSRNLSLYSYAFNNPMRFIDLYGFNSMECDPGYNVDENGSCTLSPDSVYPSDDGYWTDEVGNCQIAPVSTANALDEYFSQPSLDNSVENTWAASSRYMDVLTQQISSEFINDVGISGTLESVDKTVENGGKSLGSATIYIESAIAGLKIGTILGNNLQVNCEITSDAKLKSVDILVISVSTTGVAIIGGMVGTIAGTLADPAGGELPGGIVGSYFGAAEGYGFGNFLANQINVIF